jgi:hypothetical protein
VAGGLTGSGAKSTATFCGSDSQPPGSSGQQARFDGGERGRPGKGTFHHSWPSFCSIWSEVWMALEFIS